MTPRARIRRATRVARKQASELTDLTLKRLLAALRDAGSSISAYLGAISENGRVTRGTMIALRDAIDQRIDSLSASVRDELDTGINSAAIIGTQPFASPITGIASSLASERAVRFVQAFRAADGLQLSDRLYNLGRLTKNEVMDFLERAIVVGASASDAALRLIQAGQPVPRDLGTRVSSTALGPLQRGVMEKLTGQDAEAYRNAQRLMRTEINRAYAEGYVQGASEDEDVAGVRFRLGAGHPRPDVCDMHASVNRYGLGPGVYPLDNHPFPAHPETLSFIEVVYQDEISDEDRKPETRVEWLKRQSPSVQEAVLGSRKKRAALVDGHLTDSQINTPWKVLKDRLKNKGIDTDALGASISRPVLGLTPAGALPSSKPVMPAP